jgi:hypothetical protein
VFNFAQTGRLIDVSIIMGRRNINEDFAVSRASTRVEIRLKH